MMLTGHEAGHPLYFAWIGSSYPKTGSSFSGGRGRDHHCDVTSTDRHEVHHTDDVKCELHVYHSHLLADKRQQSVLTM